MLKMQSVNDAEAGARLVDDEIGNKLASLKVNRKTIAPSIKNVAVHHSIYVPIELQEISGNVVEEHYESEHVDDCAGAHIL